MMYRTDYSIFCRETKNETISQISEIQMIKSTHFSLKCTSTQTCIENVWELLAAEVSSDAGFADGIVAEVAADEVAALAAPAALLITTVSVLLNACVVVQRVAFLHTRQRRTTVSSQAH